MGFCTVRKLYIIEKTGIIFSSVIAILWTGMVGFKTYLMHVKAAS